MPTKKIKLKYSCSLTSDVFGTDEDFDYDDEAEALAGFKRLVESCQREHAKDGIVRKVSMTTQIGEDENEEE